MVILIMEFGFLCNPIYILDLYDLFTILESFFIIVISKKVWYRFKILLLPIDNQLITIIFYILKKPPKANTLRSFEMF